MILVALPPIPEVAPRYLKIMHAAEIASPPISLSLFQQPIPIYIYLYTYIYIYIIVLQVTQVAASMVERCPWIRGYRGETIEWKEGRGRLIRLSGEFLLFLTRKNARLVSSNGEIKREGGAEGEVGVSGVY